MVPAFIAAIIGPYFSAAFLLTTYSPGVNSAGTESVFPVPGTPPPTALLIGGLPLPPGTNCPGFVAA